MRRLLLAVATALAAGVSRPSPSIAAVEPSAFFDYVYVEPSSGAASGGHVAVLFGDVAFHFQHGEPAIIQSVKEPATSFEYHYRGLGNRGLRMSRVRVSDDSLARLRAAFERRHLIEDTQLEVLAARRRDRGLFEYLAARSGPDGAPAADWSSTNVRLSGAGYFFCGSQADERPRRYGELLRRIGDRYGESFLERRSAELRREIEDLDPEALEGEPPGRLALDVLPDTPVPFADRYRELLQAWLAVDVLRSGRGLCADALRTSPASAYALSAPEVEALTRRARAIEDRVVDLLTSRRPDWGYPLLIAIARSIALERSTEARRLVVLDTFEDGAESLSAGELGEIGAVLDVIRAEREEDFERARAVALIDSGEAPWSRLETAANLSLEMNRALDEGRPLRGHQEVLLPGRAAAWRAGWPLPRVEGEQLARALATAEMRETGLVEEVFALYRYDIVSRNCVTEVFDTIERALGSDAVGAVSVEEESRRRLGGWIDGGGLNFIPRVSLRSVDRSYRVEGHRNLPSYRHLRLADLDAKGGSILASLRESNTLTSSVYRPHLDDGVFLFFTDGAVAVRPLLGGLNILAGAGATLIGVAASPFDRGRLFVAGLRGAVFSFPELAFVNIRKGSLPVLPMHWVAEDEAKVDRSAGARTVEEEGREGDEQGGSVGQSSGTRGLRCLGDQCLQRNL